MEFKYAMGSKAMFLNKYAIHVVLPTPEKAPEFMVNKLRSELSVGTFTDSVNSAKTLAAAERAIHDYVGRVEKAIIKLGWGLIKVKLGKGKTEASRTAKIECWKGEASVHQPERSTVTSEVFVPASVVVGCTDKGYGLINQYFLTKKLAEVAARSEARSSYKRVPVADAICPPSLLEETKKRMMAQLPTAEAVQALAEAEQALVIERIKKREEYEGLAEQRRIDAEEKAARDDIQRAKDAANRKGRLAALETHTNVSAQWHNWGGTSKKRIKIEHEADGVNVHISGARAYVVLPDGEEFIVVTRNLQFQRNETKGSAA